MKLLRKFYRQSTLLVAQKLLGKFLIHQIGKKQIVGQIIETEAYCGFRDKASHAIHGLTPRTKLMFGLSGYAYVYLIYGMYYCFNIVTEKKNYPAAVLIRGVPPCLTKNKTSQAIIGPGRTCRYFKIDRKINGLDLTGRQIWLEDRGIKINKKDILAKPRVGVDYAGSWKNKPYRFIFKK